MEVVRHDGPFVDCGTPAQYLAANLAASGGESVVEPGAVVDGVLSGASCGATRSSSGRSRSRRRSGCRRYRVATVPGALSGDRGGLVVGAELAARGVDVGAAGPADRRVDAAAREQVAERPHPLGGEPRTA